MKKILCLIITLALLFTSAETAFAKKHDNGKNKKNNKTYEQKDNSKDNDEDCENDDDNDDNEEYEKNSKKNNSKDNKQEFKIDESPVIKYGRYKLPIAPITKGMGATVNFDEDTAVLTVDNGTTKIVINFKEKTVYVNGVKDTKSGIFTAKDNKKMTVLIKYIANILGIRCEVDDDDIIVEVPNLNQPTNVTVTPVGTTVLANTLNSTTIYMTASANIKAGQATGGRAELYVGSIRVATDTVITDTDTTVSFSTSDSTPTNAELQAVIPKGGVVTVKLYNANNEAVTSTVGNPTLVVDYIAPTITGITSATYNAAGNQIKLHVTGANAVGDKVDVTKISLTDVALGRTYQLTSNSNGNVSSNSLIDINLGATDKLGLSGFGSSTVYLTLATGSLLKDAAGNVSPGFTTTVIVPVNVNTVLDVPTNVTVTPFGTTVVANTLNSTTLYMNVTANITAGQATGGRAELYVGNRLVAIDSYIGASDTTVTFTTSDSTPTNAELQAAVPTGGVVTVKLYNANNTSVTSTTNPTLVVDYIAPTVTSITSVIYSVPNNQLYLMVTGASAVGDKVDVTKIMLYDSTLGRYYQLTNNSTTGSGGTVNSSNSILINIGSADRINLTGFGTSTIYLTVSSGSLLTDTAGNTSNPFTTSQTLQVTIVK